VFILYFKNAQNNPGLARNIFTKGLDRVLEQPPMKDRRLTLTRALRDPPTRAGYRPPTVVPALRVQGQWMEQAGFHVGDRVRVQVELGRLILTLEDA
jgi:hypothetical protein